MHKTLLSCALALVFGLGCQGFVYAQDGNADGGEEEKPQGFWERDTLTGDWGGLRTDLDEKGVTFTVLQTSDVLGNVSGGDRQTAAYDGLLNAAIDVDFGKLVGATGLSGHVNAFVIQGKGLTNKALAVPSNQQPVMAITNAEVSPANTLLNEYWLRQELFDGKFAVQAGSMQADNYFATSGTASLFVNSAWGFLADWTANLPGGGPQYPNAAPAVMFQLTPTPAWNAQVAFFNGQPQQPVMQDRYNTGLYFPLGNGILTFGELGYKLNPEGEEASEGKLPGSYKLGFRCNSNTYQSGVNTVDGTSIWSGVSDPQTYKSNYSIYVVGDQAVYRETDKPDQGANVFARFSIDPMSSRNFANWMGQTGVAYTGLFDGRPQDQIGLGYTYLGVANGYRNSVTTYNADQMASGASTVPLPKAQQFVELDYKAVISPWWSVQPFAQYFINPGASQPQEAAWGGNPTLPVNNMFTIGVRTQVNF